MKDTIYFRHDYNARNDNKIINLRRKFGWEGYGLFWATIEILRECTDVIQTYNDCISNYFQLGCDEKKYKSLIDYLIEINLLTRDKDNVFSGRLSKDVEHMKAKSIKAKEAVELRWQYERNANVLPTNNGRNTGKDRKGKKSIGKDRIGKPPIQPPLNSVFSYFTTKMGARFPETQIQETSEKFYNFIHEWNNWEASADTWISKEKLKPEQEQTISKIKDL